jgi:hypothetical protein
MNLHSSRNSDTIVIKSSDLSSSRGILHQELLLARKTVTERRQRNSFSDLKDKMNGREDLRKAMDM